MQQPTLSPAPARDETLERRPPSLQRRAFALLPYFIVAVALGLRLYGIGWDDGNFYHPDERSIYMRADCMYRVLTDTPGWQSCVNPDFPEPTPGFPSPGTFFDKDASPLNPHWFPLGSILIYLLVVVRFLLEPFMDQVGLRELATVGRTLTALVDAGSVLLLYHLGRRLFDRRVGLLASGLLAVTVINIQQSHFYRPEAFTVLISLGAFWWMLNVLEQGRLRDHAGLGLMVGLSFAFRASSLPLLAPVAATYGFVAWRRWRRGVGGRPGDALLDTGALAALAGAVAFGVFAVLQPYALLDFGKFIADLTWEAGIARNAGSVPYTVQYVGMASNGLYEVRQSSVWALGLPLGVLAWGGLAATAVANFMRRHVGELLLLVWVAAVLLTIVGFEVKFLRYVSTVLPVLVLLGSRWLLAALDHARTRSPVLVRTVAGAGVFVVASTALFALAFVVSYARPHPAVQASEWLRENAADGSLVLTDNHWDEGFPNLGTFRVSQLPMYEGDTRTKVERVAGMLAEADYVMAYSNRPWGSIARLPQRYPYSAAYYQALFSGELGFELVQAFERYPSFLGITFAHDPFTRAGVTRPETLPGAETGWPTFNLGYADENVFNYDRPLVLVWRNVERRTAGEIAAIMLAGEEATRASQPAMLAPADLARQREGGTWTELFSNEGLNGAAPWLVWLVLVEVVFVAALPLSTRLFRWLPDRGVVLARPLGLLLVAWLVWLGTSLGLWTFGRGSVFLCIGLVAVVSAWSTYRNRRWMTAALRRHWRYLVWVEVLFVVAYLVFVLIRAANPDLWHPWRGGEKPMDLAYLTAVVKSTTFPPYDPWYAGGYINYYYFGFVIVGALIKATRTVPEVAFNLAVPLLFALTLSGAFSVGFNLAESLRRRRPHISKGSTVAAGVASALLVTTLANVDGLAQVLEGAWRSITGGSFGAFDFWRSSRLMPDEIAINEFPFWTFLFADLHAHLISLPIQVLIVGLLANVVLSARSPAPLTRRWPALAVAAWAIGSLAAINTWDMPAYGLLGLATVGIVVYAGGRGRPLSRLALRAAAVGAAFWVVLYLSWLPFHVNFSAPFEGLQTSRWRTELWQYLAIHGLLLFIVGSWLVYEAKRRLFVATTLSAGPGAASVREVEAKAAKAPGRRRVLVVVGALALLAVWSAVPALRQWTTAAMLTGLLALAAGLALWWLVRRPGPDMPAHVFLLAMVGLALGIGIGVDLVTLRNDIERMNTVFKLYLNAWVLYGLVGGVALWQLWVAGVFRWRGGRVWPRRVWMSGLGLLVLASAVFPVLGTRARLADRFDTDIPMTLNGRAYQETAVYSDPGPEGAPSRAYPLRFDAEALDYLREHVEGSPVVLEGVTTQYRWTPRVAKYTGLPVVVGYEWHQIQQRGADGNTRNILARIDDVEDVYSTTSEDRLWELVRRYDIEYIYVGPVEKLYYPPAGIAKFDALVGRGLELFFSNDEVRVYRVSGDP